MAMIGKTNLGNNFYPKLVQIGQELGMRPEDILNVMVSESGLANNAYEEKYKGAGLIGFMPDTIKNLGFKGDWKEFAQTPGDQQLEYVKKFIQGKMAENNHGKPFTSAAQYYLANFIPAAMGLPGVKAGDPNTVFLEKNPESIRKGSQLFSKKYFDIGIKLPASQERLFYNANPVFDTAKKGYITYGDMMAQTDRNRKNALYINAVKQMHAQTGYAATATNTNFSTLEKAKMGPATKSTIMDPNGDSYTVKPSINKAPEADTSLTMSDLPGMWSKFNDVLKQMNIMSSYPQEKFLISIGSKDKSASVEYANLLSAALEDYLQAKAVLHSRDEETELQCLAYCDKMETYAAIKQFGKALADEFGHGTYITVSPDLSSNLPKISLEMNELNLRKFAIKKALRVK